MMTSKQPKSLYTRSGFEENRRALAREMKDDVELQRLSRAVYERSRRYLWTHQFNWFGEPTIQLMTDLMLTQELIFASRPTYIIECGVCWGGSLLFYASLLKLLGGCKVIGIDIFIPDDLRERLNSFDFLEEHFVLIEGDTNAPGTLEHVRALVGDCRRNMVILDSNHTHDHVRQELENYSPLVQEGQYLLCCDTVIEHASDNPWAERPWGRGNNPATALEAFMAENDRFEVDTEFNNKLLLTCHDGGILKCVKDSP